MSDPGIQSGGESRQHGGANMHTVLSPVYEHRDIRIVGIEAEEIAEQGEPSDLLRASDGVPVAEDCEPALRPCLGFVRLIEDIPLTQTLRSGKRYVIHESGWENKVTSLSDWGGTKIQWRVFAHFGYETYLHHYRLPRQLIGWRREGAVSRTNRDIQVAGDGFRLI